MIFRDKQILIEHSKSFLSEKLKSLKNDVGLCVNIEENSRHQPAPFAALLICFATLDFLAALYSGNASSESSTKNAIRDFLDRYFKYNKTQKDLLMKIYRHKLVHLYQPAHVFDYGNRAYSWYVMHAENRTYHLRSKKSKRIIDPAPFVIIRINYIVPIVIKLFASDIEKALKRYLIDLEKEEKLQTNYDNALMDIFSLNPRKIKTEI